MKLPDNQFLSIFQLALEFYLAYTRSRGNGLPYDNGEPNPLVASRVCLALSVELGLKAILSSEGGSLETHALADLFNKLSKEKQDTLCQGAGLAHAELSAILSRLQNVFVEWRYIYEKPGYHPDVENDLLVVWSGVKAAADIIRSMPRKV